MKYGRGNITITSECGECEIEINNAQKCRESAKKLVIIVEKDKMNSEESKREIEREREKEKEMNEEKALGSNLNSTFSKTKRKDEHHMSAIENNE